MKLVNARILLAEDGLQQAQDAANNETKSSAGDKYETGRAMMHLEKEKLAEQLSAALKMKKVLDQIRIDAKLEKVGLGSLVITTNANYFLGVSVGKLEVDGSTYFAISPVSPIGQQLMGKQVGDSFSFAGKQVVLEQVF